ncbi:hypothetical protein ACL7TT_07030 [Microbulbifer sp. 2304DJ12-6]|uniref:hypothetical protein n=1 Tax=Microbulbifer sp. 2304DJ12-6 TaxID=3233340 RepID=UPI0039AFA851
MAEEVRNPFCGIKILQSNGLRAYPHMDRQSSLPTVGSDRAQPSEEITDDNDCTTAFNGRKAPYIVEVKKSGTLRKEIIQRAGRIIRPKGKLVLSMAKNDAVKDGMLQFLDGIERAT